ncbi:MAG: hypothetical protein GY714_06265 [Desulfobacterales bacterium]|nr:hypothetical protein [Desulfobacterales bacterium]
MNIISDATILMTDQMMQKYYTKEASHESCHLFELDGMESLNLLCHWQKVEELVDSLKSHFFLIAGSSNFHHLEIAKLYKLTKELQKPVQLILFDHHMDAQEYRENDGILTCGNWVSFAVQNGLIDSVIMCGCDDETRIPLFDQKLQHSGKMQFHSDISRPLPNGILSKEKPTYISVDTDILNIPSDWGKGSVNIEDFLASPVWEQLKDVDVIGAGLMGHVTDNRRIKDMLKTTANRKEVLKSSFFSVKELYADIVYGIFPKLWASLTSRPLSPDFQYRIMLSIYKKLAALKPK